MNEPKPDETPTGEEPPAPFVVGAGRSGTTLLRMMLDAHPQLAIPPETRFIPRLISEVRDGGTPASAAELLAHERNWSDFGIAAEDYREHLEAMVLTPANAVRAFYGLYAQRHGKLRWGDKTPSYGQRLRMLGRWIPEAHFVHLVRDGRDVALSWIRFRTLRGDDPMTVGHWAAVWRDTIAEIRQKAAHEYVRHYFEVRYEDLIERPEQALRGICDAIGLEFDAAMLSYHEGAAERLAELAGGLPPSDKQPARSAADRIDPHRLVTEPPKADRAEAWRNEMTPEQLAEFEAVAGELQAELDAARGEQRPAA